MKVENECEIAVLTISLSALLNAEQPEAWHEWKVVVNEVCNQVLKRLYQVMDREHHYLSEDVHCPAVWA